MVEAFIAADVPVDTTSKVDGVETTPLIVACMAKHHKIVQLLLCAGANPAFALSNGHSALKLVKQMKDSTCLRMLLDQIRKGQQLAGMRVRILQLGRKLRRGEKGGMSD